MAQQRAGYEFRVWIDGNPYAVGRIEVGGRVEPIRTGNTEGYTGNPNAADARGFSAVIPDLSEGRIRLVSATFDDGDNPFSAPISLTLGEYYALEASPVGDTSGFTYDYGNCMLVSYDHTASIPGPQPMTLEFQTDGTFGIVNE